MNHIFREDGKTLIVAMDHAGVFGAMDGLDRPGEIIRQVRKGGADAILTTFGLSKQFVSEIGDMGLILRVDGGVSWQTLQKSPLHLIYSAEDALRLGADAVGVMGMPGSIQEPHTLPYLSAMISQCAKWNIPVMAEMLPGGFENPKEDWTPEKVANACRLGAELGVDLIKTTYTGQVDSFAKLVEQVYVPVIVLGGAKSDDPRDLIKLVHDAIQAGAAGVACGRKIIQYKDPARIVRAVAAIIHEGESVEAALEIMQTLQ
jgi:class I fructose-bisphosphate aldolase